MRPWQGKLPLAAAVVSAIKVNNGFVRERRSMLDGANPASDLDEGEESRKKGKAGLTHFERVQQSLDRIQ